MGSNIYVSLVLLAALISSSCANDFVWPDEDEQITCLGRAAGLYPHPDSERCAAYIVCEGNEAVERTCPTRNGIQLHFSLELRSSSDPCDLPDRACCNCQKTTTTRKSTTTTTKTPTIRTTTTTTTTTTTPRTPRPTPPDGKCYPDECKLQGYCDCYEECVSQGDGSGNWEKRLCGEDLFWLPNNITGGTCVYFENLSPEYQDKYRSDDSCIPECKWFQRDPEDTCSPRYSYIEPFDNKTNLDRVHNLTCPQAPPNRKPLYWVQEKLTCDICDNALQSDGSACVC
ncbi:unnamed protein product [Allacma fusca]|uniref:Chitin-binding type-2 domain-containing protein n=1 Tax=Allacma fusca TaxID=39272 RepID=A0A8J2L1T5_9HEXA|nr:unnamed protein product [Allacma fusca]